MTEGELQNEILDHLNRKPDVFAWRNNSVGVFDGKRYRKPGKFAITGVSDILGYRLPLGRGLVFEVKLPENKERPENQVAFISKALKMGCIAGFVTSIQDVEDLLNGKVTVMDEPARNKKARPKTNT